MRKPVDLDTYASRLVSRFQTWITVLQTNYKYTISYWIQTQMPPTDVLMVWHAYLLNTG